MRVRLLTVVLSVVAVSAVAAPTAMRTWTDARGHQVEAKALSYDGESVELEFANGETMTLDVSKLSAEDREFLEQHFVEEEQSMPAIPLGLIALGGITVAVGSLWFLVVAFRKSVGWGLACMFVPFGALVFLITNWKEAKKPFGVQCLGGVLIGAAIALIPLFVE